MPESNQNTGETTPETNQPDPLKNLKEEFNRKLGNQESALNDIKKSTEALMAQLQNLNKPATKQEKKVSVFDDEDGYAARIKAEAKAEIGSELARERAFAQKQQQVIYQLTIEFPELNDGTHDLTKKAMEIFNALPEDERQHPLAYKTAVKEAALDLDIKPKSKRKTEEKQDSYSYGSSSNSVDKPSRDKQSDKVDEKTIETARLMGIDIDDKKTLERVQKRIKTAKKNGGIWAWEKQ